MATLSIPPTGLTLHGAPASNKDSSAFARSAVLLRLNDQIIKDLRQCSQNGKALQILAGKAPRLRYGAKTIDLQTTPETFRHEVYTSNNSTHELSFTASVTQQAVVKTTEKRSEDTSGADAALANLKQSLASFAQEKEAKKTTISSTVIAASKHNRNTLHPHRGLVDRPNSRLGSPSHDAQPGKLGLAPTSAPLSDSQTAARSAAMRKALLHFLAKGPATDDQIEATTHIPPSSRADILSRIAEQSPGSTEWKLTNKYYKELDVWVFAYKTESDRQAAVDNAIRAFDRMRIGREDKVWQMLLPKRDRGKGTVLSRLQSGSAQAGKGTPMVEASSPMPPMEKHLDSKMTDVKSSAESDPATTPKIGAGTTGRGGMSIEKRLKESKKQRAAEVAKEAKEQKKKDKDAAASDRETKPRMKVEKPAPRKLTGKVKSDAVVHSSDDDVPKDRNRETVNLQAAKPGPLAKRDSKVSTGSRKVVTAAVTASASSKRPGSDTSDSIESSIKAPGQGPEKTSTIRDQRDSQKLVKKVENASATPKPKVATPRVTPSGRAEKHAVPPAQKVQLSPRKVDTKPRVPSPLGPTRARNTSDVSEKKSTFSLLKVNKASPVVGVTRVSRPVNSASSRGPASNKPSQQSSVNRKRALEESSDDSERPRKATKVTETGSTRGAIKAPGTKSNAQASAHSESGVKRKTADHEGEHERAPKHRRTESSSSQSVNASGSSLATTTAGTSVATPSVAHSPSWQHSPSDGSTASDGVKLSWERALEEAEKFRTTYYPAYIELYDRLQALPTNEVKADERKKLRDMHERLRQMKAEIRLAVP